MSITVRQLAWAAGFLEGEGSFQWRRSIRRNGKTLGHHFQVTASQVQKEPLERLQRMFGGPIKLVPKTYKNPNHSDIWRWDLTARSAVSVMMTLYTMMSPWRQDQIREAVAVWKTRPFHSREKTHCPQGHPLSGANVYREPRKHHRTCRICQAKATRKWQLKRRGIGSHLNPNQMRLLN